MRVHVQVVLNVFNGFNKSSIPSVIEIGEVVSVKMDVINTSTKNRMEMKIPCLSLLHKL